MKSSRKRIGGALIAVITILVLMICFTLTPNAEEIGETKAENTINVWLIGGQSNAVGYGKDAPMEAESDTRYYTGFENVLYYGNHEQWKYNEDDFVPTTIGLGRTADNNDVRYTSSGSEIGIANALGDTGEMNAIIKFAYGGTYLYPKQSASINDNAKTWTSPSYLAAHPEMNTGSNIGALYTLFVDTVTEGLSLLREKGYTPVVKGMWWMQGENEGMNETYAAAYEELLRCLVNDVRAELGNITGEDYSDLPFICGNVMRNPNDATQYPALDVVNAAQAAVANELNNVAVLTKSDYSSQSFFGYHDGWHFNVDTYNYMGEKFVEMVLDMTNENLVSVVGEGIEIVGAGIKGENESVTVTVNLKDGYSLNGVTLDGNAVSLDGNNSYTFTMQAKNVVFNANTTYSVTEAVTDYGVIPAEFNNPEKYPFVLFNNESFVGAYEYYGKALSAVPTVSSTDNYTLLLRKDYTTVTYDSSTAVTGFGGNFTLDLGGNTMVRGNRAYIFEIYSNNNNTYPTALNVKNGYMYSTGDFSLISFNYSTLSNISKVYNITFENIVFSTNYEGRGTAVVIDTLDEASTTDSAGFTANVTFNGCTFDFGTTSGTMMKFSNGSATKTVVNAKINGGSIVSKASGYSLYSSSSEDKVTIGTFDGSYPTVTLPTSVTPPAYTYTTESGEIYGIAVDSGVVSGDNTVYSMGVQSLNTKYGVIAEEFKDSQTYKFALFKVDATSLTGYSFVSGYSTFADVCNAAGLKGSPVASGVDFVILVRTGFTNQEGVNNMQKFYNNVVIDLGGNTVTLTTQHFLPLYDTPSADAEYGKITIKNGTIINNSASNSTITAIRIDSGNLSKKLTFNVDAEDVTFKVASGSKSLNGAVSMSDNKGTANLTLNATFTNCTFDYTNSPSGTVMMNVYPTQRIANINIVGGKIIAGTNNAFTFAKTDSLDNAHINANSTGATLELLLAKGTAAPSTKIENLEFVYDKTEGEYDVYKLVEKHVYGDIPAQYTSSQSYPVLLFKADKTFVRGYTSFAEAAIAAGLVNGGANSQVNGSDAIILFRCDHVHVGESGNMNSYYNNVTIDLGGHTVQLGNDTVKKNFLVLYANNAPANGKFGTITVKNGTFKNMWNNTAPICFNGGGSVGNGIVYTVNYENVTFTVRNYTSTIYGAIRTWGDATKNMTLNATYNNCTFDYTGANTNAGMFGLSYNSKTTTVFNITINGGQIIAGDNSAFNLIEADANDTVIFGKNTEGNYTTLSLTAGSAASSEKYNDDTMAFVYSATENGNDIYVLEEIPEEDTGIETEYGIIPSEYASSPIVVFKADKTFVGAYSTFGDACKAAGLKGTSYSSVGSSDSIILIRSSFTNTAGVDNMQNFHNNITIDLGGNTITLTTQHFLPLYLGNPSSATSYGKITVKNGTIINNSASNDTISAIRLDSGTLTNDLTYNVEVENVRFAVASTSRSLNGAVSMSANKGTAKLILNATFKNCTFDFVGAPANTVIFNVNATQRIANVNIIGGQILGGSTSAFKLIAQDSSDKVLFVKDSTDAYTTLYLAKGTAAPTTRYNGDTMGYFYLTTNENYDVYELREAIDHKLNITTANSDVAKYALTLYVNGEIVSLPYSGSFSVGTTLKIVAKTPGKYNYTVTMNGNVCDEFTVTLTEDVNIEIGISENSNVNKVPVSNVTANEGISNNASWAVGNLIDGNRVAVSGKNGFSTNNLSSNQTPSKNIVITFELDGIQTINQISIFPRSDTSAADTSLSCNYPVDFTISVSKDGSAYVTVLTVTNALVPLFAKQQCYEFDDVEAKYVKLTITKLGLPAKDEASNNRHRVQLAEVEIYNNTKLTTVKTDYGTIPNEFVDENTYPFVVFKTDGTFVRGYETFKAAVTAAGLIGAKGSEVNGEDCVILFRADYSHTTGVGHVSKYYNNVTIDLGGHNVTTAISFLGCYFDGNLNDGASTLGKITIKNGSFVTNYTSTSYSIIRMDNAKGAVAISYDVDFINVKISTTNTPYVAVSTASSSTGTVNVKFINCVFDYTKTTSKCYMVASGNAGKINATIIGGQIIAGTKNTFAYIDTTNSTQGIAYYPGTTNDSVTLEKNNGEFVTIVLNNGVAAPTMTYKTAEGVDCVFVKASANDTATTYKLYPAVMVGYKVKTSVTLWSNFVYNIYIPGTNFNGVKVNGLAVDYEEVEIDGVVYYHVAVNLPAGDTLSDINLCVTLNSGSTTVDANWTLNVYNYTKSVLAGEFDDTTKTLMKDMLVYASAAHTYFDNTTAVAEKLAEINTLLGDYTAALPTGEAKQPTTDTYFTKVEVYVGEVPSFRFYLAEGYTADDFTFKVGKRNANVTVGDGYVEIVMYAYMMLDDVTFTVKGTDVSESYNLYSYYAYAKTLGNANLTAVVEALMKYSVSAKAYRDAVIGA